MVNMKCPKDGVILEEISLEGYTLDSCKKCDGLWMDWGELTKLSKGRITEHELIFRGDSFRLCPRCGKKMRKADLHSVIIEECKCGIFFDKGEAQKVLGMDLIAQLEKIDLTKEQLSQLNKSGNITAGKYEIQVI